jgi:hypothetical protein
MRNYSKLGNRRKQGGFVQFLAAAAPIIGGALGYLGSRQSRKSQAGLAQQGMALANRPQRTGLGSAFNPGGTSYLAPAIQDPRAQILADMPGYKSALQAQYGLFGDRLGATRGEFIGNESPFMQAALSPLQRQGELAIGGLERSAARRGLAGSSLANMDITNARREFGQAMADTTARVRDMQLARRLGIDEAALNAGIGEVQNFAALDQQTQQMLAQQATEQLNLLGLTQDQVGNMLQPLQWQMQANQNYATNLGNLAFGTGTALGQVPWGSIGGGGGSSNQPGGGLAGGV